jgi:hypothetical protein
LLLAASRCGSSKQSCANLYGSHVCSNFVLNLLPCHHVVATTIASLRQDPSLKNAPSWRRQQSGKVWPLPHLNFFQLHPIYVLALKKHQINVAMYIIALGWPYLEKICCLCYGATSIDVIPLNIYFVYLHIVKNIFFAMRICKTLLVVP